MQVGNTLILELSETAAVAEWVRVWGTFTMFGATVCGRIFSHLNMHFLPNSESI